MNNNNIITQFKPEEIVSCSLKQAGKLEDDTERI